MRFSFFKAGNWFSTSQFARVQAGIKLGLTPLRCMVSGNRATGQSRSSGYPVIFQIVSSLSPMFAKQLTAYCQKYFCVFTILALSISGYGEEANGLSAGRILESALAKGGDTFKAKKLIDGHESVFYQKRLSSGVIVSRQETHTSVVPTNIVHLHTTNCYYQLFPDYGLAIDMSFIESRRALTQAQSGLLAADAGSTNLLHNEAVIIGKITDGNVECYQIEEKINSQMLELQKKLLPDQSMATNIPVRNEYSIGVKDLMIHRLKTIALSGVVINETKFSNIETDAEIPDELFQLPAGVIVQKPKSVADFSGILKQGLFPNWPKRAELAVVAPPPHIAFHPVFTPVPQDTNLIGRIATKKEAKEAGKKFPIILGAFVCINILFAGLFVMGKFKRRATQ